MDILTIVITDNRFVLFLHVSIRILCSLYLVTSCKAVGQSQSVERILLMRHPVGVYPLYSIMQNPFGRVEDFCKLEEVI